MGDKSNILTVYRCLRSEREVRGGIHDEFRAIINRNPEIDFVQGVTGVEAYHNIHKGTMWDEEIDHFPLSYLNGSTQGRLGFIVVRFDYDIGSQDPDKNILLCKPNWNWDKNKKWYRATRDSIEKVVIEKIIEVVPLEKD